MAKALAFLRSGGDQPVLERAVLPASGTVGIVGADLIQAIDDAAAQAGLIDFDARSLGGPERIHDEPADLHEVSLGHGRKVPDHASAAMIDNGRVLAETRDVNAELVDAVVRARAFDHMPRATR